jgi:hypothetical protein
VLVGAEQLAAEPVQVPAAVRVVHGYLGEQPVHSELGAQLVRGVRGEPTLALVSGHEPVKRSVDSVREFLQRVGRAVHPDALAEVLWSELADGVSHVGQGAQRPGYHPPAAPPREHQPGHQQHE